MIVTVLFQGICTHVVSPVPSPQDMPSEVRVALVDARFGLFAYGKRIPPHEATLSILPHFIADAPSAIAGLEPKHDEFLPSIWTMQGVELEIVTPGSTTNALTFEPDYFFLPSLSKIAGRNPLTDPLEINRRVVDDGAAACNFIIRNGTLDALKYREAVHGMLTVEADAVQLRVTRFWDRSESIVTLKPSTAGDDPVILVGNAGIDDDKDVDFLLHYGVTTFTPLQQLTLPPIPVRPATKEELKMLGLSQKPQIEDTITHGCSNSIYP